MEIGLLVRSFAIADAAVVLVLTCCYLMPALRTGGHPSHILEEGGQKVS